VKRPSATIFAQTIVIARVLDRYDLSARHVGKALGMRSVPRVQRAVVERPPAGARLRSIASAPSPLDVGALLDTWDGRATRHIVYRDQFETWISGQLSPQELRLDKRRAATG